MLNFKKNVSACIAVLMFLLAAKQASLAQNPQYSGKVTLQGLQQNVEVFFDKFGIPHIYGKSLEDAYFALGFVHAQERISQFELLRRLGTGTFAEVVGAAGTASDVRAKTLGIVESARRSAEAFRRSPKSEFKKSLQSYLAGINAYLATLTPENRPKDLLPNPSKYTIEDVFASVINAQFAFVSLGISSDVITTQLKNTLDNPAYFKDLKVLNGAPVNRSFPARAGSGNAFNHNFRKSRKPMSKKLYKELSGLSSKYKFGFKNSNGWAVSGRKSTTGKPFFSSDTHIGLSQPDSYYEAQLVYPGQDLYGLFFPFSNLCVVGHNQHTSWGLTVMLNDDVDLYQETLNAANPNQVKFRGQWVDLKTRKETVRILQPDGTLMDSTFDVKITPHGPIINSVQPVSNDDPISLFYVGFQFPDATLEAFFDISNAKNIRQFKRGVRKHIAPGYNFQYADKQGNIAWFAAAKLLKRRHHVNPKVILDGASGRDEPLGYFPFSKNPRSINPPSGFVSSANNQIGRVNGKLYPGYYVSGTRAKKIKRIFRQKAKFSSNDLQALFNDNTSELFKKISQTLLQVIRNSPVLNKSANHQKAVQILSTWKGEHELDSKGPIVFYQLYYQLLENIFQDEVGTDIFQSFLQGDTPLYDVIDRSFVSILRKRYSIWYDDVRTTDKRESRADIFARAFDRAVVRLTEDGVLDKTWGEVHQQFYLSFTALFTLPPAEQAPYFVGPVPFKGGIGVLNKTELDLLAVGTSSNYSVAKTNGPGNRTLVDFSDIRKKSLGILPTGQSGVPTSPFYQDQAPLYNNGQLRPMLADRSDIEKQSSRLLLKKPRPAAPNVGDISGSVSACDGDIAISYSVEPVENADIYIWTLPVGVTQSNTGKTGTVVTYYATLEVDFGSQFNGGAITIAAKSIRLGTGHTRSLNIEKCANARSTNTLSQELNNKRATLFPNPITNASPVNIQLEGYGNNTPVVVQIIDVKGRLNRQISGKLQGGKVTLSADVLSQGLNIIKIKIKSEMFSFQVIKNK
ncbi:MAG TPA: hypothetical protein DCS93_16715 [Microscillaceae bacterium]|nr:hypothetical protein [Microscillaceae bacterium]